MRVLVTDDSAFMRRAISGMLSEEPGIEIVGLAHNGKEAVDLAVKLKPDVITLDIEMPEMDGLTALRQIMRKAPTRVLMVSSLTTAGSVASLQALKLGAADVLAKDMSQVSLNITQLKADLVQRVRALAHSKVHLGAPPPPKPGNELPSIRASSIDVVCIGSSTGGPPVLETLLSDLPADLPTPIVIAQHMPRVFTESMSKRLDDLCPMPVHHAEDGMPMMRGHVYLAQGGQHIHLTKTGLAKYAIQINGDPADAVYRPSVSALFSSAAAAMGKRVLAIVLTGIGEDGLTGAQELHALGAPILAQTAETCVVYGMPKAVTQAALVQASLAPADIHKVLGSLSPSFKASTAA